jgi:prepilin-type N-terminal cleavage/methylation domain-containing protein
MKYNKNYSEGMDFSHSGFTMLELVIVIVIIGVLATLGIVQYSTVLERSRGAEAKQVLGTLRSLCFGKYMGERDANSCTDANLTIGPPPNQIPGSCTPSHWFRYGVVSTTQDSVTFRATRCKSIETGKNPPAHRDDVDIYMELTTDFASGGINTWKNENFVY